MIAVEFPTRRRTKVKGQSERASDGTLIIHAARVYSQRSKYIQAREPAADSGQRAESEEVISDGASWRIPRQTRANRGEQ